MIIYHARSPLQICREKSTPLLIKRCRIQRPSSAIAIPWASMNTECEQLCRSYVLNLHKHTYVIQNSNCNTYTIYTHYPQHLLQSCKTIPAPLKNCILNFILEGLATNFWSTSIFGLESLTYPSDVAFPQSWLRLCKMRGWCCFTINICVVCWLRT
jgi:hypothetical protein